jgi:hypothetical protein
MLFCAGATKAGTSWLYDYLRDHPETYMRTIKELQFFNRQVEDSLVGRVRRLDEEIASLESDLEAGRAKWPTWILRQIGDRVDYRAALMSDDPQAGYLRYLTASAGKQRLVGEMTPEYGLLPVEKLREISALAPDVRWIFLLRDPVARLWSHVRMLVRRKKLAPDAVAAACEAMFERVLAGKAMDVTLRGDYAAIHGRLVQAVAPEKLMVMVYEQMMAPEGLARVTGFLGLSDHPAEFDKVVHGGLAVDMPEPLRQRAREWLRPQYAFVAGAFGLPAEWELFPELNSEVA